MSERGKWIMLGSMLKQFWRFLVDAYRSESIPWHWEVLMSVADGADPEGGFTVYRHKYTRRTIKVAMTGKSFLVRDGLKENEK